VTSQGDKRTRALCYLIAQVAAMLLHLHKRSGGTEFDWITNRADFDAFRTAILRILDWLAPVSAVDTDRYTEFTDPVDAGGTTARMIMLALSRDSAESRAYADASRAPSGSAHYAFPQAAEALNFNPKKAG